MFSLLIIAEESDTITELCSKLVQNGYTCRLISNEAEAIEQIDQQPPDLALLATDNHSRMRGLSRTIKQRKRLPIIALATSDTIDSIDGNANIDDFLIEPYNVTELLLRIRRLLNITSHSDNSEIIRCGDLLIDLAKYEVSVGSRPVMLTFREYELLRFLASNRGRVFTRDILLTQVWDHDYLGGDRTVDVHIRRLRSKIEASGHTFIETVRNIGYRFTKDP